jgi:uncharacterized BrkB/YihY/UPF0761 family membrane protein
MSLWLSAILSSAIRALLPGMKAVIDALNVVYDEREERGFVKLTLVALAFTLGSLAFIILALGAVVAFPLALAWIGFESRAAELIAILRWPALFVIVMLGLAVLYRYGPNRTPARWRWLSIGTLLATLAWLAISALFSWRRDWSNDVALALSGCDPDRWRVECRDGTSNGARYDNRAGKTSWDARCGDGGHAWRSVALTWK